MSADLRKRIRLALLAGLLVFLAPGAALQIIDPEFGSRLAGENSTTYPLTTPTQIEAAPTLIAGPLAGLQTCGIYFLSLPDKCLINGEYKPRLEYSDRRMSRDDRRAPVPTPYP